MRENGKKDEKKEKQHQQQQITIMLCLLLCAYFRIKFNEWTFFLMTCNCKECRGSFILHFA